MRAVTARVHVTEGGNWQGIHVTEGGHWQVTCH